MFCKSHHMTKTFFPAFCVLMTVVASIVVAGGVFAQTDAPCTVEDRLCVIDQIHNAADHIDNKLWRDQTLRELAKTLAFEGKTDEAIAIIDEINSPDTQAMTIRGIGMVVAENNIRPDSRTEIFAALRARADEISHDASHAIALTYIAMAQAFAGDDTGAWATAADMTSDPLRHKAYAETAEIQAEQGKFEKAMRSIGFIESEAFRNKAYSLIGKILADKGFYNEALNAAQAITNEYKKAQALQYILDAHKPREQTRDSR